MALSSDGKLLRDTIVDVPSSGHHSLTSAILAYLEEQQTSTIAGISVGIAGPVIGGKAEVTNLGWIVCKDTLMKDFGKIGVTKIALLNDLEAFAWGINSLSSSFLFELHPGKLQPGNKAIVAAGTGLGMAGVAEISSGQYAPFATEGGHSSLSIRTEDAELLAFLSKKYDGHVSSERVVSGKFGFVNLYEAYKSSFSHTDLEPFVDIDQSMMGPTVASAAKQQNPLALKIIDTFMYYYGVAASNFALSMKATGGVYIAGGIAPKLKEYMIGDSSFKQGFLNKGRFSDFLKDIPVYLVEDEYCALEGSEAYLACQK